MILGSALTDCGGGGGAGASIPTGIAQGAAPGTSTAPSPTTSSTPGSSTASASTSPSAFLTCKYPSGDVWNTDVSSAPVAPNSASEIQATVDGGDTGSFNVWIPDNEYINAATDATPMVSVHSEVSYHAPYSPIPWTSVFSISPLSDHHAMVLQEQTCQYYEGYQTIASGGVLYQYNGARWDLTKAFTRPASGGASTSSGIPIGLVSVRPEELSAGSIEHALGWGAVAQSVSKSACVSPAGMADCTDDIAYDGPTSEAASAMPYGSHIRLRSSFDDSAFPREAKIVAEALKRYGAYLYDTGCCDEIPFINDQYGSPVWTLADSTAIQTISIADFDVVAPPQ
jgi:hypothetical protein